jgi:hypothetical protein
MNYLFGVEMSFSKIFVVSGLFCLTLSFGSQANGHGSNLAGLIIKSAVASVITGTTCGFADIYIIEQVGLPLAAFGEGKVRGMIVEELLPERKNDASPRDNERYTRQKKIAEWFGFGASWITWVFVIKYGRSYLKSRRLI